MSSHEEAPERIVLLCRLVLAVADPHAGGLDTAIAACAGSQAIESGDVEESLLLAIPYCGFPGSVEALGRWRDVAGPRLTRTRMASSPSDRPSVPSSRDPAPPGEVGQRVFAEVYGDLAPRVLRELSRREPRLELWIREFAYGRVMGGSPLPLDDLEALGVAALLAQGRRAPLHSHLRGARRAGWSAAALHSLVSALAREVSPSIAAYAHGVIDTL